MGGKRHDSRSPVAKTTVPSKGAGSSPAMLPMWSMELSWQSKTVVAHIPDDISNAGS
jgi:hypothetical protein